MEVARRWGRRNEEMLLNGYEVLVVQPRASNTELLLLIHFDAKGPALC